MAFSLVLSEAHLTADSIETTADVTLTKAPNGFSISAVHLVVKAKIPGAPSGVTTKAMTTCTQSGR